MWRFCVRSIIVEKMWRIYGIFMELWWRFSVHLMEKLWRFDGSFVELWWRNYGIMEKILDWNMAKLCSVCGESTRWKITSWKIPKRDKIEWYAKQTGRWKNVSENCRLGKHWKRQGGFDWNYLWCRWNNCGKTFLFSCVPSDWIPCGHMEHFLVEKNGADKISALFFFFFWKNVTGIIALRARYGKTNTQVLRKMLRKN